MFLWTAATLTATALAAQPAAHADSGWVAVAHSPTGESLDWSVSASRQAAEERALEQCAVLQNPHDCRILASGPNCVAVAWDIDQPLNRPHAVAADTPAAALTAAVAAAGTYANDPDVRCSYFSQDQPSYQPPSGSPPPRQLA